LFPCPSGPSTNTPSRRGYCHCSRWRAPLEWRPDYSDVATTPPSPAGSRPTTNLLIRAFTGIKPGKMRGKENFEGALLGWVSVKSPTTPRDSSRLMAGVWLEDMLRGLSRHHKVFRSKRQSKDILTRKAYDCSVGQRYTSLNQFILNPARLEQRKRFRLRAPCSHFLLACCCYHGVLGSGLATPVSDPAAATTRAA
jgi:hypothetical protein